LAENAVKEIILTVPMVSGMELAISKTVESLEKFVSLNRDQIDETKHAIIEACINSFEHSNSQDNRICLTFNINIKKLTIKIADHGSGFDPSLVEDPKIEEKLFKKTRKRGWGLKLIKHLMDEVTIQSDKNGTIVTMIKYPNNHRKEKINECFQC